MTPRLARRRLPVEPTYFSAPEYVETYGPEVAELCARAGLVPDEAQQLALDVTFGIQRDGRPAAFEVDLIGPRQVLGKTAFLKMCELGWMYVTEERLIVHSAHELDTTQESFRELAETIESHSFLSRHLKPTKSDRPGITEGNGRWAIELKTGPRARFKARTPNGGRGLTGNRVILDEGFAVTAAQVAALYPALGSIWGPQVVTVSSAGLKNSEVLRDHRDRGRVGASPSQAWIEFTDPDPRRGCRRADGTPLKDCVHPKDAPQRGILCALDDEDRWARFMTSLGRRTPIENIRNLRQSMPPEKFAAELMVWWDDPIAVAAEKLDMTVWEAMGAADAAPFVSVAFGVTVAPNRSQSFIGAAGLREDGKIQVELVAAGRGARWPVDWLATWVPHWKATTVLLDGTAASMSSQLEELGVDHHVTTVSERAQAAAGFFDDFTAEQLLHPGEPLLDRAVETADRRQLQTGFVWEGEHVGPLQAVSLARLALLAYAAAPKPPPSAPRAVQRSPDRTADRPSGPPVAPGAPRRSRPRRSFDPAKAGF